jgi:hypothetical protein
MENHHFYIIGKSIITGPFSIAMLNYQRVYTGNNVSVLPLLHLFGHGGFNPKCSLNGLMKLWPATGSLGCA